VVGRFGCVGHGLDVRVTEEAEVDRKEEGKVPPCGDGSGGEAAREVRRAWAWRSSVEGSGGGENSTGRGGKMGPGAGSREEIGRAGR
jgi:hypothetical protein